MLSKGSSATKALRQTSALAATTGETTDDCTSGSMKVAGSITK